MSRRARSAGRGEREPQRLRSEERQEREPRRRRPDEEEFVKVTVEKYEPRHRAGKDKPIKASQQPPQKLVAVKKETQSSKHQDTNKQRGKTTAAAEDPAASSSEYTYEYESVTLEAVTAGKKALPAGKKPGNVEPGPDEQRKKNDKGEPLSSGKKAVQPAASRAGEAAQTDGGADAGEASSVAAAGQHRDLMVALLTAAMQTARR